MSTYPAVLYIEDDPKSRMVMSMILMEHMGLECVQIFEDSANIEAQLHRLAFQPDIVFLDIHMEPLNGFEVLIILRSDPVFQQIPIVALTASVMNEEIQQLRNAGFNGVISKPIDIMTFPDTLNQLLRGDEIWRVINR